jgi:glucose/arabinose dehydrogenase
LSRDIGSLAGTIPRMTRDGQVPKNNLFESSYMNSYGYRNPWGLA